MPTYGKQEVCGPDGGPIPVAFDGSVNSTVNVDLGTDGTSPPSLPGGSTGVRGWLRYLSTLLPGWGSAGNASPNVITVQGIANGTVLPVAPNFTRSSGEFDANTQRVTLATNGPGVAALSSIDGKIPALVAGRVPIDIAVRTPNVTSVVSSVSSVTILASNNSRKGLAVFNDSTSVLRLSFATPATSANAFVVMQPGQFLLLDSMMIGVGAIYGIWVSANGTAQVTEWT